jgi:hypothetical protein
MYQHEDPIDLGNDVAGAKQNVVVPKAQYTVTLSLQNMGANLVVYQRIQMLASIKFNHQMCRQAHEIHDVTGQWMLSAKFMASQLLMAQEMPQAPFCIGTFVAQPSSTSPYALHGDSFARSA